MSRGEDGEEDEFRGRLSAGRLHPVEGLQPARLDGIPEEVRLSNGRGKKEDFRKYEDDLAELNQELAQVKDKRSEKLRTDRVNDCLRVEFSWPKGMFPIFRNTNR